MRYIEDASYVEEYKLIVWFDDHEARLVDLRNELDGAVFEPLKDIAFFSRFVVNRDIDTIVWPNGADFSPDFLYEISEPADAIATGVKP